MALFGNRKDAAEWQNKRGKEDWFRFRNKDEPSDTLGKKLEKEQIKRRAAEKEVTRLKKEVEHLKAVMKNFTGGSPTH